jgi:two-component system response regulator RegX3
LPAFVANVTTVSVALSRPGGFRALIPASSLEAEARKVLVIDSDTANGESVSSVLTASGFVVRAEAGRQNLLRIVADWQPDIVVLDIDLRDGSGLDACRELRQHSGVPVLFLSGRTSEFDVVVALEVGGDGYIIKPWRSRELVARVRAVLRRQPTFPVVNGDVFTAGDVVLDVGRHVVEIRGEVIRLPLKEFALLELLVRHPGRAVTRGQLIEQVWGRNGGPTKTLDLHIKRLREHIEADPAHPKMLVTVRGFGFRLEAGPVSQGS